MKKRVFIVFILLLLVFTYGCAGRSMPDFGDIIGGKDESQKIGKGINIKFEKNQPVDEIYKSGTPLSVSLKVTNNLGFELPGVEVCVFDDASPTFEGLPNIDNPDCQTTSLEGSILGERIIDEEDEITFPSGGAYKYDYTNKHTVKITAQANYGINEQLVFGLKIPNEGKQDANSVIQPKTKLASTLPVTVSRVEQTASYLGEGEIDIPLLEIEVSNVGSGSILDDDLFDKVEIVDVQVSSSRFVNLIGCSNSELELRGGKGLIRCRGSATSTASEEELFINLAYDYRISETKLVQLTKPI